MRPHLYLLEGKKPVPASDAVEWGKWYETSFEERLVARTILKDSPHIRIQTDFIGIDLGFAWMNIQPSHKPLLFETMVFGGPMDGYQSRYSTWVGAQHGHEKVVRLVKEKIKRQV